MGKRVPVRRCLVAATLAGAMAITLSSPASAQEAQATSGRAASSAVLSPKAAAMTTQEFTLKVRHGVRDRVTVAWGDGYEQWRYGCAHRPVRGMCTDTFTYKYGAPGTYTVNTTVGARQIVNQAKIAGTPTQFTFDWMMPTSQPDASQTAQPVPETDTQEADTPTTNEPSSAPAPAPAPEAPTVPAGWQDDMLARVNAVRTGVGASPLTMCGTLQSAAQGYSEEMVRTDTFSHTSPSGLAPVDRAQAGGYGSSYVGENIAAGYASVADAMTGWINSPGHYANLIKADYTHVGFGYAAGASTYGTRWVQNFGAGGTC